MELNLNLIGLYVFIGLLFASCTVESKDRPQAMLDEEGATPIVEEVAMPIVKPQYAECPIVSDLADQVIEDFATEMWGSENCRFRVVIKADDIEVVLFALEGSCEDNKEFFPQGGCGNRYERYMGGVAYGRKITPVRVGGKSGFAIETAEIIEGDVVLTGRAHQFDDAACCPSKLTQRRFKIGEMTFEELSP